MASIELRTPKNKPAYYTLPANNTLKGRTIRKYSRFENRKAARSGSHGSSI